MAKIREAITQKEAYPRSISEEYPEQKKKVDRGGIYELGSCCGCERRVPIKWEESAGILARVDGWITERNSLCKFEVCEQGHVENSAMTFPLARVKRNGCQDR